MGTKIRIRKLDGLQLFHLRNPNKNSFKRNKSVKHKAMEMNRTDKSSDEPDAKRRKIESEDSTSPKSNDPFLSLPSDILAKIIVKIPIAQWASLELFDEHFRAAILIAWRQLRSLNVDRDFFIRSENVESILQTVAERSPFLTSLSVFAKRSGTAFSTDAISGLVQFEHLQSLTVGNSRLFNDSKRGIPLESVVELLESTRSRTSLKELYLYNIVVQRHQPDNDMILDRLCSSFVSGREIQSPLKLEKLSFTSSDCYLSIRLDTLDTSRLTELCVGQAAIEPDQLIHLIERTSNLLRIELSFLHCECFYSECDHLRGNTKLLAALASHESLTAIKFDTIRYWKCHSLYFEPEFIQMLESMGRRGNLRKLALEDSFELSTDFDMDHVCRAIRDFVPHLKSIKVFRITHTSMLDIAALVELAEIYFMSILYNPMTTSVIGEIARLAHLKRLHMVCRFTAEEEKSLESLANVAALTDLRIPYVDCISAYVFGKWSEGFASNLEILMLTGISAEDNEHVEEGLVRLLEKATRLRVLVLDGMISDQSLIAIAKSCRELETLWVRSSSNEITSLYLQETMDHCPKLMRLGGLSDEIRSLLQFPKYRKIDDADMEFWMYDFDDREFL